MTKTAVGFTIWKRALVLAVALVSADLAAQSEPAQRFTVLYSFKGTPDGATPLGSLIRNNYGTLYGTTNKGGTANLGTIFKLDRFGTETVIHSFSDEADGTNPSAGLVGDAEGNLYGITVMGGRWAFWGTLFKVDRTGNYTVIINFNGDDAGGYPEARLLRDAEGYLYGTTDVGGIQACPVNGCGVVFKVDTLGHETVLHYFTGVPDGWNPNDLLRDAAGNLYGTTKAGGLAGACALGSCGTIFKLDPAGQETVLYSFTGGADGASPHAGLVRDAAGNLYGNTYRGGVYGYGVIFKLDTARNLTVLHSFTGGWDGANPQGGLMWGSDGKLYGTTLNGGTHGYGVVFRLTKTRTFTVLHSFTGGSDGAYPYASLFRGPANRCPANAMYGTASAGGTAGGACGTTGCGTIFRIMP